MGEDIRWHAQTESSDLFHQWSSSRCSIIDYINDHLLRFAKDWMRFALVSPGYVCRHSPSSLFFIPFGTSCLWTRKMPAEITIKRSEITIFTAYFLLWYEACRPLECNSERTTALPIQVSSHPLISSVRGCVNTCQHWYSNWIGTYCMIISVNLKLSSVHHQ